MDRASPITPSLPRLVPHEFLLADPGKSVRSWDPHDPPRRADFAYIGDMLAAMEAELPEPSLTVVTTTDHRKLPRYGRDVVVIQRGGPDARPPRYAKRVLAVFKTQSSRPLLAARPAREPPRLTAASGLAYLQAAAGGAATRAAVAARFPGRAAPVVEPIPMGVMWPCDGAFAPITERPIDVLFNGSIQTSARRGLRRVLGTPKMYSRQAMLAGLAELQAEAPELRVEAAVTPSFAHSKHASADEYWRRLGSAKLCLAPRGDTLETYRVFEAARAGCIVLAERLPSNWFHDGAPVLDQTGWRDLARSVRALLADESELVARHRATVRWWDECVGPEPVGRHIAAVLRRALEG